MSRPVPPRPGSSRPAEPSDRPTHARETSLETISTWLREAGHVVRLHHAGTGEQAVTGLTLTSRRVRPGDLYAALPGARSHGATYAAAALDAGAVAVLTDEDGLAQGGQSLAGVPVLVVDAPRVVLGLLAAGLHGSPATAMTMIGVTGTQGKTTTTRLVEGGLSAAGVRAAVIGTVGTRIDGQDVATSLTTPEAPDLHALFAVMREWDVAACAMEVSSHALVMGRVDGVVFDVAVFLNLGRDHLDFHTDVEDYYRAKASLFTPEHARLALVNVDDEHGRRLASQTVLPVRTFSTRGATADWTAHDVRPAADGPGLDFEVQDPHGQRFPASVALPGAFNVENALAALAACGEAGHDVAAIAPLLGRAVVPGRMEPVLAGQDFAVVVDYAHKPDAVEAAVAAVRATVTEEGGRVIVVIGAGGDRDTGKRPLMGEIAGRLADVVIVTDDNPRTEDPAVIRAEVVAGVGAADLERHEVREIGDRREAITTAIGLAQPGDVVLVAGKGHETGQEVAGVVHAFDDRIVAREALATRTGGPR